MAKANKKVRLAIIGSILIVLLVAVLSTTTIIRLKEVSVQFVNNPIFLSMEDSERIIDSGEFEFGSNLLFTKYDNNIASIEKAIPYAKVIKLERKFPNKAILHIEERTPVFRVYNNTFGQYSIYDKELKVLRVTYEYLLNEKTGENSIPILSFDSSLSRTIDQNISAGNFLDDNTLREWIVAISEGTFNYNSTLTTIMSEIVLGKMDDNTTFTLVFDNDVTATIIGENNLQDKVFKAIKLYSELGAEYTNYDFIVTYEGTVVGSPS